MNAPQNHTVVQLEESCSSGSQIRRVVELCLLNKFYSELQHIKDKCDQPAQYPTKLDGLQYTQQKHSTTPSV